MTDDSKRQLTEARVAPSKEFFVNMLTRDIDLGDAVLDLLDNCLDGIVRSGASNNDSERPYEGFYATLKLSEDGFVIEDNCGGIPIDVAEKYAFAMGRPTDANKEALGTIGMYGIGMKRAIFKLGTNAVVESRHIEEEGFYVEFTPEWMRSDGWGDIPVYTLPDRELTEPGTKIEVLELNDEAERFFSDERKIDEFRKTVARHYSLILAKGFQVRIGRPSEIGEEKCLIKSEKFQFLSKKIDRDDGSDIEPFVYRGYVDNVFVEIYAGLNRPLLSQDEIDQEEDARASSDEAGWTVACNDRVVIWKDKTRLTGWGEANVPHFHGQFIPITGVVLMYSEDPKLLPLTTTKRGIDAASNVYSSVKDMMREATKELTKFTNRWKKYPEKRNELYEQSKKIDLSDLRQNVKNKSIPLKAVRRFEAIEVFQPKLPSPANERTDARISYLAAKDEIEILSRYFFESTLVKNEEVGRASFELALRQAKGGG